jgi:hypothetical protein
MEVLTHAALLLLGNAAPPGMPTLRVLKMTRMFVVYKQTWPDVLLAGTRELLRTLGRLKLHTLELRNMPLGSIAKELVEVKDGWRIPQHEELERLVLNDCNMDSDSTRVVLSSCKNLRELELRHNIGYISSLGDEGFGVGRWLKPVELPKLQRLDVQGTHVTPAGVAHLPGVKTLDMRFRNAASQ